MKRLALFAVVLSTFSMAAIATAGQGSLSADDAKGDGGKIELLGAKDGGKIELGGKDGGKVEELATGGKDGGKVELSAKDGGKIDSLAKGDGGGK